MKSLIVATIALISLVGLAGIGTAPTIQAAPPAGETLIINLPPSSINTPNKLRLEGCEFTFSISSGQFDTPACQGNFVTTTVQLTASNIPYYQITVTGFGRGEAAFLPGIEKITAFERLLSSISAKAYSPPPATNILCIAGYCRNPVYDITLTFAEPVAKATVNNLAGLLETVTHPYAFVGDISCSSSATIKTHLCLNPLIEVHTFSGRSGTVALLQAVERDIVGEIIVDGNVLATQNIGGFSFPSSSNQRWIAVGGAISAEVTNEDSQKLTNYLQSSGGKLLWGDPGTAGTIANQLHTLKDEGNSKATQTDTNSYSVVNLISPSRNLADSGTSTFSSGPEGKIWKTLGNLTLNNPDVRGVGTIVVTGNLVVNGDLSCQAGTRFGLIATGSITFGTPQIGCGAYTALGGGITVNGTADGSQSAKGIFVARDTIDLPSVQSGAQYHIRYDTGFALDPAALFRQLLSIVFTTTS